MPEMLVVSYIVKVFAVKELLAMFGVVPVMAIVWLDCAEYYCEVTVTE
jgi:hypothetical protein